MFCFQKQYFQLNLTKLILGGPRIDNRIRKDNLVATLPSWGDYFEVSLQLWIESFAQTRSWTEVFRFTASEKDCCSAGDRIPALFVNKAGFIYATSQVRSDGDFHNFSYIKPKTWTSVQIKQYSENGRVI